MKVGIIGCGNIGVKRAQAVSSFPEDSLIGLVETDRSRWPQLKQNFASASISDDPGMVMESKEVEVVVISTPPRSHVPLIEAALKNGKDVLCEKPLGEHWEEVKRLTELAARAKKVMKCGFNLRHDRGLERARALCQEGTIGHPYFLRGHYVNGCVLVNTNRVGSLMDLGSHLLDLVCWFVGEPEEFAGFLQTTEFSGDDNGFVSFRVKHLTGQIHFSLIRWRNDFGFEISGDKGSVEVVNLPKWGRQELRRYRRVYPSGVPEMTVESFEGDWSWEREWKTFRRLVEERDFHYNEDALKVARMIASIQKTIPLRSLFS